MSELEEYFKQFREQIVGNDATFESPYGTRCVIYADWIASGRLYAPIEKKLLTRFGPFVASTHLEHHSNHTSWYETAAEIPEKISHGDLSEKPGWVRWSLHPTMTGEVVAYILRAVEEMIKDWFTLYSAIQCES